LPARDVVGAHLPAQHQFGEGRGIAPGQRMPPDRDLVLDDAPAGLDGAREAGALQGVDQRAFPRPRAAGQDEEAFIILGHCIVSLWLSPQARRAAPGDAGARRHRISCHGSARSRRSKTTTLS
jgi:hypothetical protein